MEQFDRCWSTSRRCWLYKCYGSTEHWKAAARDRNQGNFFSIPLLAKRGPIMISNNNPINYISSYLKWRSWIFHSTMTRTIEQIGFLPNVVLFNTCCTNNFICSQMRKTGLVICFTNRRIYQMPVSIFLQMIASTKQPLGGDNLTQPIQKMLANFNDELRKCMG